MMPFDGAGHLDQMPAVLFVSIVLSWPSVVCWSVLAAAIALYYSRWSAVTSMTCK
jgi:hypothetical protein